MHFLLACFLDILLPYVDVLCLFLSSKSRSLYSGSFLEMLFQAPPPVLLYHTFVLTRFSDSCTLTFKANLIPNPYSCFTCSASFSPPVFVLTVFKHRRAKLKAFYSEHLYTHHLKFTFNIFIVFVLSHCPSFHPSASLIPAYFGVFLNIFQPSACLSLQFA